MNYEYIVTLKSSAMLPMVAPHTRFRLSVPTEMSGKDLSDLLDRAAEYALRNDHFVNARTIVGAIEKVCRNAQTAILCPGMEAVPVGRVNGELRFMASDGKEDGPDGL